jgi:hypothetical protein
MLATPVNKCKAGEKTMTRFGGTGQMGRKDATGRSRCNVFGKSFCILTITHLVKDVLLLSRKLRWGPFGEINKEEEVPPRIVLDIDMFHEANRTLIYVKAREVAHEADRSKVFLRRVLFVAKPTEGVNHDTYGSLALVSRL